MPLDYQVRRAIVSALGTTVSFGFTALFLAAVHHAKQTGDPDGAAGLLFATAAAISGLSYLLKTLDALEYVRTTN